MMDKKIVIILIVIFQIMFFGDSGLSYDDQNTHPKLTNIASNPNQSLVDKYITENLGFEDGLETELTTGKKTNSILKWLEKGSTDEDSPICRASNHFHDPLESWDKSYMSDDDTPIAMKIRAFCTVTGWPTFTRKSNITWATGYLDPAPEGKKASFFSLYEVYNWDKARDYYYKALTSLENSDRESFFAKTFETVGHTLHLLQDVSVPAHVRNDFQSHLTFNEAKTIDITKWVIQPFEHFIKENKGIVEAFGSDGILPEFSSQSLTKFWDTDQYTGSNPSSSTSIGLAEYANTNFLSDTTIFKVEILDPLHSYPYPAWSSVEEYDEIEVYTGNSTTYLRKVGDGEEIDHLAAARWYYKYLPSFMKNMGLELDDKCHYDYAEKIIPRAVGYSAGLLNYFFRGDINLKYETDTKSYVIGNNTVEDMNGTFELFYDNNDDVRNKIIINPSVLSIPKNSKSTNITFTIPNDAKEPGRYILVFRGTLGNEKGAVVGRVTGRVLEITPPNKYVYSVIDGSQIPQQFTKIKAKIRNITGEEIKNGTLQAVAEYIKRTDYQPDLSNDPPTLDSRELDFSYSVSDSINIESLNAIEPTEYTFDFTNSPIPAGITDLYLKVIFNGTIGDEINTAQAIGTKDLMEPTHHVFWNLSDMVSLYYHLYTAEQIRNDPDLIEDAGDLYIDPYTLTFNISYMSESLPEGATSPVVEAEVPPGRYIRLIVLVDKESGNYVRMAWTSDINMDEKYSDSVFNGTVYQEEDGIFKILTPVYEFRLIREHFYRGVLECKPLVTDPATGQQICIYPEEETIPVDDPNPVPVNILFP